jgi:hypothetical protein
MIDPNDPCGAATQLRAAYHSLIMGQQAQEVEFDAGNGSRRRVKYSSVNLAALQAEIQRMDNACAALTLPTRPKRFGIRAGGSI